MKTQTKTWLALRQLRRDKKSVTAAIVVLLISSLLYTCGWMMHFSLSAYNTQFADSTGKYDFELNAQSVPESGDLYTLRSISTNIPGAVEGRDTALYFDSDPSVLYPGLISGEYPKEKENEILVTYPAAILFDVSVGDTVEVEQVDAYGEKSVLGTMRVSGIAPHNFSRFVLRQKDMPSNTLISGWYEVNDGISLEQIKEALPNANINYQRDQYKYSDRTHRLSAARVIIGASILFVACVLLSLDLLWIQKGRKDIERLYRSGMPRKECRKMQNQTMFALQITVLMGGFALGVLLWKAAMTIAENLSEASGTAAFPVCLPFDFPAMGWLALCVLIVLAIVCVLLAGVIDPGAKRISSNRRLHIRKAASSKDLILRPLYRSQGFHLICLLALLSTSSCLGLSVIAANTPVPAIDERTMVNVAASITFEDSKAISAFFEQTEERFEDAQITMTAHAAAFDHEPVYALPTEDIVQSSSSGQINLLSAQAFEEKFGADVQTPVMIKAGNTKEIRSGWFLVGNPTVPMSTVQEMIEARKALIVEADVLYMNPDEAGLNEEYSGAVETWYMTPQKLMDVTAVPAPIETFTQLSSFAYGADALMQDGLEFMKQWDASTFSSFDGFAMVRNLRRNNLTLIMACLVEALLFLLAGAIALRQLLILLVQSQKADLLRLVRAGLLKKTLSHTYQKVMWSVLAISCVLGIVLMIRPVLELFAFDPLKAVMTVTLTLLICLLVNGLSESLKLRSLLKQLLETKEE